MISAQDHHPEPSPLSSTDTFSATATTGTSFPPPVSAQLAQSFSAISEQLLAASRALSHASRTADAPDWAAALYARLDGIEANQRALRAELDAVRDGTALPAVAIAPISEPEPNAGPSNTELVQQVAELKEAMLLKEAQVYAKLQNSRAVLPKQKILAPPTKSGRPPQNFPATRGEFEHLTRERYEAILKAYDQPLKGDTAAKKEAARVFLGLPSE